MNPEEIYLEHLRSIERIAAFVARRSHLSPDDTAEFVQEVRVRLLDDDYAIIRKFEGRSSFSTYLTTVIVRLFHQWRVQQWGKWRPSAEAKRLGDKAITLERLLSRDGYTFDEAVKVLTTPAASTYTRAELEALYLRLPVRVPRPVVVADDSVPESSVDADAEVRAGRADRAATARRAAEIIDGVLATLPAEDRLVLQLRFWHAQRVPDIAQTLHLDQKKLYKRLDKLFALLRRSLENAGLRQSDVADLLTANDQEIRFETVSPSEIRPVRPSHVAEGDRITSGEGTLR